MFINTLAKVFGEKAISLQKVAEPISADFENGYRVRYQLAGGVRSMRVLVALGLLAMLYFIGWFVSDKHIGYAPLFWLLTISLGFKLLRMLHEWAHYVQVQEPILPLSAPAAKRQVDVLTTACPGEPIDMIVRTLKAMQAMHYPHTSYLCDEGNDPQLRQVCQQLGVVHVTRTDKSHAKAGNINNALRQATGDYCVVLDPDHVLAPDFLDNVMPYFEDDQVGFVQVVQAYGNQEESLVARGAAEQTYHFYGPLMMGMNAYGTVQAIGANCTFRRAALDSIGGHAAGLTEDMHTAMRLHAAGWKSVYVPKVLSRGLVPASLAAYYSQQLKWARGAFDLLFRVYPRLWSQFTWAQRLHYLTLPLYFLSGVITLIDIAVPVASLYMAEFPWHVSLKGFMLHMLPLGGMAMLIRCCAQQWLREPQERGLHLAGGFLRVGTWWVYTLGFIYAVLGVRVPYIPTPKEEGWLPNEWRIALPNLLTAMLLLGACKYGRTLSLTPFTNMMVALSLLLSGILVAATVMGQHEAIHNFMRDMATRPYRFLALGLNRLFESVARTIAQRLRRVAVSLSISAAGVLFVGNQVISHSHSTSPKDIEWLKTGGWVVHAGLVQSNLTGAKSSQPRTSDIQPFVLASANSPQLPVLALHSLPYNQVALLTWPVPSLTQNVAHWRDVARQMRQVTDRPLMLRPLFPTSSAAAHRRAWRALIDGFRAEGMHQVMWLWTPRQPADLADYCPGASYVDWLVVDHPTPEGTRAYRAFQRQFAEQFDLHRKPVLLMTTLPTDGPNPEVLVSRVAQRYPEVKAVIYDGNSQERPLLVRQYQQLPSRPAADPLNESSPSESKKIDNAGASQRVAPKS